jgi:2-polyprenyl-3-methyl-5-hydroxy-6-metoxy-1,4-benzoquinol methylase
MTNPSRCPVCAHSAFQRFARLGNYTYERCGGCGLLLLDPFPTLNTIEKHYLEKFETGNYQTLLSYSDRYGEIYGDYVKWIGRHVRLSGKRTLDIGCFTGELVARLMAERADAFGVELQEGAVQIAEKRLPGRVFSINIDEANGPFPDASLDVITLMAVLEHVQEPVKLVQRIRALLKGGGWLFLQTPNASSWPARLVRRFWPLLAPVEHLHLFSERAIRHALEEEGFDVVELRPHVKWLPAAYVYDMLQYYGPEWRAVVRPIFKVLPESVRQRTLFPFFAGEMLIAARARPR